MSASRMELSFENFNNVAGGAGPNAVDPREIFKRNLEKVVKDKKGGGTKDASSGGSGGGGGNTYTNNNQGGKQNNNQQGNENKNSSKGNSIAELNLI